jgi:hypothetical protein
MSDFNLRAAVRDVIDSTDLADPRDVAAKVAESIPSRDLRRALTEALATFVRVEFGRGRMTSGRPAADETEHASARSAKVAAFRKHAEQWRKKLRDRVHVGGSHWLLLADCSYENLTLAAEERRQLAAANAVAAERYERYAKAVEAAGVERFGDLPESTLRDLLSDEGEAAA